MDIVKDILLRFLLALLCAGGIAGILVGAGMLLRPERLANLNQYFSHWINSDKITEQLDRPRWTERFFYRHHRLVGIALFLGAVFILYTFLFSYNVRKISAATPSSNWGAWDAVVGLLLIGSVVAALVGSIVMVRPSMLREIETWTNRWIATDGIAKFLDSVRFSGDLHVIRYRKTMGTLMIIGSLYVLLVLGPLLLRGGWKF